MSRAQLTSTVEQNAGGAVAPFVAGKNKIINGDMAISQRGTSFTSLPFGTYTLDRWCSGTDGSPTRTVSQQTFTPGAAPVAGYEGSNFLRIAQTVAGSGATYNIIEQRVEDVRIFAGQTITFSFWGKAAATTTVSYTPEQVFGNGGSSVVENNGASFSLTTNWQRFTATTTLASISGKTIVTGSYLNIRFYLPINSTFTVDIWGVQLEAGSVATPFTTATGTVQGELAACQRYFINFTGSASTPSMGAATTTVVFRLPFPLPVTMRATPSASYSGTPQLYDGVTVTNISSLGVVYSSTNFCSVDIYAASSLTQYRPYLLYFNNGTINLNAEL
jgi:hypothetical protein